jgi:hypothetical protein
MAKQPSNPAYNPAYIQTPSPGHSQPYYAPPPTAPPFAEEPKSPYEGNRFKPKTRINDPFFLIFFILQVSFQNLCSRYWVVMALLSFS